MRKALAGMVGVGVLLLAPVRDLRAQVALGYTDVGGVIGLGNINNASIAFGGRFEKVFKKLPDLGDGLLGIGVSADVYSYDVSNVGSIRVIPFGATANYHFKIDPKTKFDAFLGAGLGFQTVSCSGFGSIACGASSGLYFIGRAGGRYFMKPNLALYADAGAGAASINIGVTVKLK